MYLRHIHIPGSSPSLQKLVRSLEKSFLITRNRDLEKAIELACCLQVLGERTVFLDYIESFIYDIEYGKGGYAWGHKCDGLALLAYDADAHGDEERRQKAVGIITSRNFDDTDLGWLVENASLELDADDHEQEGAKALQQAGIPLNLTPRERQQGHYSRLVLFAYYHQLLKAGIAPAENELIARLASLVERERRELRLLVTIPD